MQDDTLGVAQSGKDEAFVAVLSKTQTQGRSDFGKSVQNTHTHTPAHRPAISQTSDTWMEEIHTVLDVEINDMVTNVTLYFQ